MLIIYYHNIVSHASNIKHVAQGLMRPANSYSVLKEILEITILMKTKC